MTAGRMVVAAVVLVVLVVAVGVLLLPDDDGATVVDTGATSTSTEGDGSEDAQTDPIWTAPASVTDPEMAAIVFAADVLGIADPVWVASGPLDPDDPTGAAIAVTVAPGGTGPPTTIGVTGGGSSPFEVLGAISETIEVSTPTAGGTVAAPVEVVGTSDTFEGNVVVDLRLPGDAEPLARTFATGGANGTPGPFSVTLELTTEVSGPVVLVVLDPDQSGAGGALTAVAIPVTLG